MHTEYSNYNSKYTYHTLCITISVSIHKHENEYKQRTCRFPHVPSMLQLNPGTFHTHTYTYIFTYCYTPVSGKSNFV